MQVVAEPRAFARTLAFAGMVAFGAVAVAEAAPVVVGGLFTENVSVGCASGSTCEVVFSAVPSGKQLEVQRVSCAITEQQNRLALVKFGVRTGGGHITRESFLPATLLGGAAGIFRHVVNNEVDLVIRGSRPMLEVVSDLVTTFQLACQISGKLTTVPS